MQLITPIPQHDASELETSCVKDNLNRTFVPPGLAFPGDYFWKLDPLISSWPNSKAQHGQAIDVEGNGPPGSGSSVLPSFLSGEVRQRL